MSELEPVRHKPFSEEFWAEKDNADRCTGTSFRSGNRCLRPAIRGATVCHKHGGRLPVVRRAAAANVVEAEVTKALAKRGVVPLDDPIGTYELLIATTVAKAEQFVAMLDKLIEDDNLTVTTVSQGEQMRAVALGAERWLKEARLAVHEWFRLGLDEQRLKLDAVQTRMYVDRLAGVLDSIVDDTELALTPAQKATLRRKVVERLRG